MPMQMSMSMTTPVGTEEQAPPTYEVAYTDGTPPSSYHGSIGPFIAALVVITILGAIAIVIGRLCSGRRVIGKRQYDFGGWVETKFASCIDGRLDPAPPAVVPDRVSHDADPEEQRERGGDHGINQEGQEQERAGSN